MADRVRGAAGEVLAARFLREKGYALLSANDRSRFGEIDIIAVDGTYIAFVEVKTRGEDALYAPREAVTAAKQKRILRTAMLYIQSNDVELQPRFDVIEIVTKKDDPLTVVQLDHILGAFDAGDLHEAF